MSRERGYELARSVMKEPVYARQGIGGTPWWDGSDPRGTRTIVHGTMGFGDCAQFARVATILHDAGATVTVMCRPPMHRLIQTVRGVTVRDGGSTRGRLGRDPVHEDAR